MIDAEGTSESSATPLSDIFSHNSEPEGDKPSSAAEKETKDEGKEEASQKLPEDNSSPDPKGKDEKPKAEKQAADKDLTAKSESKPAAVKEGEPTPEEKAAKEAADAKAKWENEENPYFKRYKDTSSNWQKEHQEKLQLQGAVTQMQQEMATLRKIADGTYDPEVDDPARRVTPEQVATHALGVGKALASKTAAIEQHGKDVVEERLAQFHEHFGTNPMVQSLVLNSESPVHEAFRILDRFNFETKYGSSPADWHKSIRAEAEKELREKIKAEVTEELMGRADKKNSTPRGLSSSRGSNGLKAGQNSSGKGPKSLEEVFSR